MLGSLVDAEDLLQETLIAAWRGLESFSGRSSLRAWLYSIATNRCLNSIRDARRRPPPEPLPPFYAPEPSRRGEVTWLQPYPDAMFDQAQDPATRSQTRETVRLAFIAALQRLPPRQTAALLLVDVLGFSTAEVATMMDTSPTAVKGALQRARASVSHQRVTQPTLVRPSSAQPRSRTSRGASLARSSTTICTAWSRCSPTTPGWPCPRRRTSTTVTRRSSRSWRRAQRGARGAAAAGTHARQWSARVWLLSGRAQRAGGGAHRRAGLDYRGRPIRALTRFLDADLHRRFGLPDALDPAAYESAADFFEA